MGFPVPTGWGRRNSPCLPAQSGSGPDNPLTPESTHTSTVYVVPCAPRGTHTLPLAHTAASRDPPDADKQVRLREVQRLAQHHTDGEARLQTWAWDF